MNLTITIEGVTPILFHRFHEDSEQAVSGGTSTVMKGNKGTPREQAEKTPYVVPETGELYIPGTNIQASIIAAGKFHKVGKSKLTTMKTSLIPAFFTVNTMAALLGVKDFEVDSRPVTIPSTGGKIMRHRARLDTWKTTFSAWLDEEQCDEKMMRQLVDDAGKKIGLCDFRPERKGPFGKFVVTKWKKTK
jgi:hypothetical protein